ncbi:unnamed protein product [Echinostoma caproni]|uniref:Uncharacterized protein n=1 Tax=Echinostoma caproni TaxID=27848 RepID=A0A183AL79_9TREM|nr:unnamed protein product [Echinostoma caproni]
MSSLKPASSPTAADKPIPDNDSVRSKNRTVSKRTLHNDLDELGVDGGDEDANEDGCVVTNRKPTPPPPSPSPSPPPPPPTTTQQLQQHRPNLPPPVVIHRRRFGLPESNENISPEPTLPPGSAEDDMARSQSTKSQPRVQRQEQKTHQLDRSKSNSLSTNPELIGSNLIHPDESRTYAMSCLPEVPDSGSGKTMPATSTITTSSTTESTSGSENGATAVPSENQPINFSVPLRCTPSSLGTNENANMPRAEHRGVYRSHSKGNSETQGMASIRGWEAEEENDPLHVQTQRPTSRWAQQGSREPSRNRVYSKERPI